MVKLNSQTRKALSRKYDAVIRAVLLPRAALCSGCIALKAGLSRSAAEEALMRVYTGDILSEVARCHACLNETLVHWLG